MCIVIGRGEELAFWNPLSGFTHARGWLVRFSFGAFLLARERGLVVDRPLQTGHIRFGVVVGWFEGTLSWAPSTDGVIGELPAALGRL